MHTSDLPEPVARLLELATNKNSFIGRVPEDLRDALYYANGNGLVAQFSCGFALTNKGLAARAEHRMRSTAPPAQERNGQPPLSDREAEVLALILNNGPLTGKEICNAIDGLDQATLRRHIIKKLKETHGVHNRRGVGYYIDQPT